jgi:hypothetical protein
MVDIHATTGAFLIVVFVVIGVSGTMGYLMGRLRTLERHPVVAAQATSESPSTQIVLGLVLLLVGLLAVVPIFGSGVTRVDLVGITLLILGLFCVAAGVYNVGLGLRGRPDQS